MKSSDVCGGVDAAMGNCGGLGRLIWHWKRGLLLLGLGAIGLIPTLRAADSESTIKWTPVNVDMVTVDQIRGVFKGTEFDEFMKSGQIDQLDTAEALLKVLVPGGLKGPCVLHVVRWSSPAQTKAGFQKWYLYDPETSRAMFYLQSEARILERVTIAGHAAFELVYLYLASDDGNVSSQERNAFRDNVPTYSVEIAKKKTDLMLDFEAILSLVGAGDFGAKVASLSPDRNIGRTAHTQITTPYPASTIKFSPSTPATTPEKGSTGTAVSLTSATYIDEGPAWLGLGAAVPVKKIKELKYDKTAAAVAPKEVKRQSVYLTATLFVPPVVPRLARYRYLPSPFVGLPLTGKVFRHPIGGVSISLRYLEVFFAYERNSDHFDAAGARDVEWKSTYGVKLSVANAKSLIK